MKAPAGLQQNTLVSCIDIAKNAIGIAALRPAGVRPIGREDRCGVPASGIAEKLPKPSGRNPARSKR